MPASRKNNSAAADVKIANDGVVDRADDPPPLRQLPGSLELFQLALRPRQPVWAISQARF